MSSKTRLVVKERSHEPNPLILSGLCLSQEQSENVTTVVLRQHTNEETYIGVRMDIKIVLDSVMDIKIVLDSGMDISITLNSVRDVREPDQEFFAVITIID